MQHFTNPTAPTRLIEAYSLEDINIECLPPEYQLRAQKVKYSPAFRETPIWRDQVGLLCKELRTFVNGKRASYDHIAAMFGLKNNQSIIDQWNKYQRNPVQAGRPSFFNDKVKDHIVELVRQRHKQRKPITIPELIDDIQYTFHIDVKQDTLRHFIYRTDEMKIIFGIPKEEDRVYSSEDDIASFYSSLRERLSHIPAPFVFNVDETVCSRWTDKRELHVIVPKEEEADTVDIPTSRNCKRHTLTACIA
jgi:hypothetical protein